VSEEYPALDITSISSYSSLIPDCEWGYNRDGETLPQVNMCLLYGEKTELPVYQTQYSGSLNDRAAFKTTMEEMKAVSGGKRLIVVMDKGFYSENNIKTLISGGRSFLVSVPFTALYAKGIVKEARAEIDSVKNMIKTSSCPIRGKSISINFAGAELTAHVLYNPEKEPADRNILYAHTAWLKENIEAGKNLSGFEKDIEKYLAVYDYDTGAAVTIRQDVIDRELETSGWMVILGSENITAQAAHDIYRRKDAVEKAFLKYKNHLGMGRLRVHDAERMRNKSLAAFISLILISAIHKTMKAKNLYKRLTINRLFMTLSKLKLLVIDGRHILRPITKEQRTIFSAFGLPLPFVG
jgi:transposase